MGMSEPDLTDTYTTRARASINSSTQQSGNGDSGEFSTVHVKLGLRGIDFIG